MLKVDRYSRHDSTEKVTILGYFSEKQIFISKENLEKNVINPTFSIATMTLERH